MTTRATNDPPDTDPDVLRPELFDLAPLLDPARLVRADTDVGTLWLHAHDTVITPWIQHYRMWEPETASLLRTEVHSGMGVLDIGANIGYHTLLCAQRVGSEGRVIALEPEPGNFALLCANLWHAQVANVEPLRVAAAAYNGRIALSLSVDNTGDHRTFPGVVHGNTPTVPCARVDDLLRLETAIDVVKLDIQGSDHYAVQGMERTLARWRPTVVVEFWPHGIREMGDDPADVLRYYRSLGYTLSLLETPSVDYARVGDDALTDAAAAVEGGFGTLVLRPRAARPSAGQPESASVPLVSAREVARLRAEQDAFRISHDEMEKDVAGFQRSAAAHLASLTTQVNRLEEYQSRLTADTAAFQQTAVAQLSALMESVASMDARLTLLDAQLHPIPYMADPALLRTIAPDGRPLIGYHASPRTLHGLYRGFEDIFRGSEEFIRERQRVYLPLLGERRPVLDIGCGRGEFLDLLAETGIPAVGVDLDADMIARCRAKGHTVYEADGLNYLADQPDESLGAIFLAQVIEHLSFGELMALMERARRKLAPDGLFIAETVNPHALSAFKTFWVDPTHHGPIFPEVAVAFCWLTGFHEATILFPNGTGDLDTDRRSAGEYAVVARTVGG